MRKHLSVAAAIASAVVIAACSSSTNGSATNGSGGPTGSSAASSASSTSPADLKKSVQQAMAAATSFHMVGNAKDDSGKPIQFDIHFGTHQAAGSVVQSGTTIAVINPGGQSVYFKAPDALWQQEGGAAAVALFHDKWVKVPANDQRFTELTKSFDKDAFVSQMMSDSGSPSNSDLQKVGSDNVNGTPATKYRSTSDHSELYVASQGAPVILKIVDSSSTGGALTFSDYGTAYAFTPPPASETVDFAKLEQGSGN